MAENEDKLTDYPQGTPEGNANDNPEKQQEDFSAEAEADANQATTNQPA